MKRFLLMTAALGAGFAPASALGQSSLEGRWKNGPMEIVIGPCGATLCGKVVKASARQRAKAERGSGTELLGAKIIDNIEAAGQETWNAEVFLAGRNMYAPGTIEEVGPDQVTVRGCVAIICKTTHWSRMSSNDQAPASDK